MTFPKIENEHIPIILVDTNEAIVALSNKLSTVTQFGFDTEFDRFCREYGFKLFLLQIFDGETCYLVDPLAVTNLATLWPVFEDEKICKVTYSCSEDIQLLKLNNCFTKNIYDIQMVAKLCNHTANSFSDLIKDLYEITLDKSLQRCNWRTRPLNEAQQIYASNDVIWLLKLKEHFNKIAINTSVTEMINEENKFCEEVVATTYVVKLSPKQMAKYSKYHQQKLLKLLNIRNVIAEQYNYAPFYVVADTTLEYILENKHDFLNNPFNKGFCSRLQNDEQNKALFINEIKTIDENIANIPAKKSYNTTKEKQPFKNISKEEIEAKCKLLNEAVLKDYGQNAAEYILRGVKKSLMQMPLVEIKLKKYQQKVIEEKCTALNIEL